ncbi:hypothetical protein PIROE2DRAFT_64820 [Piromyces sp. E2]|nr:hypothetical protein PIROE2DRAFT_64820 [Piromyces sp. E2]|eukprot:OUM57760.1 hypothetical protein PIROE2DRAFT_64820 [Piromyces sp. E2]
MNKKSTDEIKPRKSTKTFFSKFWKVASPQPKDDKKKISKSVDNINDINENNVENIKNLSENLNNSRRKSKSLDILNNNVDIEDINIKDNVNFPEVIESDKKEVVNAEEFEQNKINIENQKIIDIESKNKTKVDSVTTDNDNKNEIEENALINNNISQHSSQEPIDGNDLGNNNSKVESINNLSNSKEDNENVLSVVQEEQNLIISDQKEDNSKENNNTIGKEGLNRKSNLTLIIDNNEVINEINGLTPKEFADKLYNTEETEYEGKQISLILTKT